MPMNLLNITELLTAIESENFDLVQKIIYSDSLDYNINTQEPVLGWAPLHTATTIVSKESLKILQILIRADANLNIQNNGGFTPLHVACIFDNFYGFKLLLDAGADISIKDKENKTPLDLAIEYKKKQFVEILQVYQNYKELNNSLISNQVDQSCKKLKL